MKHRCPICKKLRLRHGCGLSVLLRALPIDGLGAWAAEKYVVSDPIFDEEDIPEPIAAFCGRRKQRR